jgi:hypothetical protein
MEKFKHECEHECERERESESERESEHEREHDCEHKHGHGHIPCRVHICFYNYPCVCVLVHVHVHVWILPCLFQWTLVANGQLSVLILTHSTDHNNGCYFLRVTFFPLYVSGEPAVNFYDFLLCRPSQRSACSQVPSQVATYQEIGSQLWAGETLDSNLGLQDNSLVCYHWATMPP